MNSDADQLVAQMLEDGETAKDFLRRKIELAPPMPELFLKQYIVTALWSSTLPPFDECTDCGRRAVLDKWNDVDEPVCSECSERQPYHDPPADGNYGPDDLAPETLEEFRRDCQSFWKDYWKLVKDNPGQAGHDFWLTRNGHGAGFLDGDWPEEDGKTLTDASRIYGSIDLYVSDDGKIRI